MPVARWWNPTAGSDRRRSGGDRSVVAEQPDLGRIKPCRLGNESLPRLGRVAGAPLDRLQFLLARLTIPALVGPLLMTLGTTLLGRSAFDFGVARFGECLARRSGRLTRGGFGNLRSLWR